MGVGGGGGKWARRNGLLSCNNCGEIILHFGSCGEKVSRGAVIRSTVVNFCQLFLDTCTKDFFSFFFVFCAR